MRQLPGWDAEDHAAALAACARRLPRPAAGRPGRACADAAEAVARASDAAAKRFLESYFRAERVAGEGVLTGYFSPAYDARGARRTPSSARRCARAPADPDAAPDRATIDAQPAPDALAWMRPEDLFFLQIQGSGVLAFADGRRMRAVYAGSNGRPFVAVAGPMVAEGLIAPARRNAAAVHDWLAAHRGAGRRSGDAARSPLRLLPPGPRRRSRAARRVRRGADPGPKPGRRSGLAPLFRAALDRRRRAQPRRRAAGLPAPRRGARHRRGDQGRGARRPLSRPGRGGRRGGGHGAPCAAPLPARRRRSAP